MTDGDYELIGMEGYLPQAISDQIRDNFETVEYESNGMKYHVSIPVYRNITKNNGNKNSSKNKK